MLELYQIDECPYCARVRKKLEELGVDYVSRIVPRDRSLRDEVEKISSQRSVPVLVDPERNEVVIDSEKIVDYLIRHFAS